MAFRKPGHPDTETAGVGMPAPRVELRDVAHEIGRVAEGVTRAVPVRPVPGQVAREGEDIGHALGCPKFEGPVDLLHRVTNAREVRYAIDARLAPDAEDEFVC